MLDKMINYFKSIKIFYLLIINIFFPIQASNLFEDQSPTYNLSVPSNYFSQLGAFSELPIELIHEIFSYCSQEATVINHASFTIITGYTAENVFKRGVGNPGFVA